MRPSPRHGIAHSVKAACALLTLLIVVSLVGCSDPKPELAIVGDSITKLLVCRHHVTPDTCGDSPTTDAQGPLRTAVASRYQLSVRATGGQRIDQMLPDAKKLANGRPDVFAENLGSNDALQNKADWQPSFDQLLALMLPARCVILTTVATNEGHHPRPLALAMNRYIVEAAAGHPNVRVVDWDSAVEQHQGEFSSDDLHPTTVAAQDWLSLQYRAAADSCH
jgi:hypothetical protein